MPCSVLRYRPLGRLGFQSGGKVGGCCWHRCARRRQWERGRCLNAELDAAQTERYCEPDREGRRLLSHALDRFALSARAAHRVLRVARSIADLAGAPGTRSADIAEALALRTLELKRAAW